MSDGSLASRAGSAHSGRSRTSGFTLIEIIITMVIALMMTLIALPLITNVYRSYQVNAAVSAITGAIQGTRYQAISAGYPFQVAFSKANWTYQVQSDPNRVGTFTNVGGAVPLTGASAGIVLGQDTTLQFHPGGLVTASVGSTTLTMTCHGKTESIAVSSYGNIKVTD
jgi:prepilin-type N-terminal cleavage/methylation domain-containing protein